MRLIESLLATILVLTIMILPVVWAIDQVIDTSDNTDPAIREANTSTEDVAFNMLVEALTGVDEDGIATLELDKGDINELVYSLTSILKFGSIEARSIYIEESKDEYRLCIPASIFGIRTMLSGGFDMFCEDDVIFLRVTDIRVAKARIGSGILSYFNIQGMITDALSKMNIESGFSSDTLTIKLTRENIGSILAMAFADNSNAGLFCAMYNLLMLKTEAVDINIASPIDAAVSIDFNVFGGKSGSELSAVNTYTKDLLDREVISSDDVSLVSEYYVNGYDRLSDDKKTAITDLLAGEQDAEETASYKGIIKREKLSLVSLLVSQFDFNIGDVLLPSFKISDSDINDMLSDLPLIGTIWQFSSSRDNSCVYIAIKDLYTLIEEDRLTVYAEIDINGYVITLDAGFVTGESPLVAITGTLDKVHIGGLQLDETEVDLMIDFLGNHVKQDWICIDGESRAITLDFTSTFEEDGFLGLLLTSGNSVVTTCEKYALKDGGYIQIKFAIL